MKSSTRTGKPSLCHLCGGELELLHDYKVACQVTSDCKPWMGESYLAACQSCGVVQKPISSKWAEEVDEIYANYSVYAQAEGGEQLSFNASSGANRSRSQAIVSWLLEHTDLPENGTLLDIGCGNGSFLREFSITFPNWKMVGAELDDRNRPVIESIPGVTKLHCGPLEELRDRFDLIVMIHSLEHIPNPIEFLISLRTLFKETGSFLAEVPDIATSPFDILIADHCTHFSSESLRWTAASAGLSVIKLSDRCVAKELTLFADNCKPMAADINRRIPNRRFGDIHYACDHLRWLELIRIQGNRINGKVGVFGTSISATWLAETLQNRVSFFVDEDPNRIGKSHLGIPIISIETAPPHIPILMPIRRDIALAIISRLGSVHCNMIAPPVNLH